MAQREKQVLSESDLASLLPASREVAVTESFRVKVYELTLAEIAEVVGSLEELVKGLVQQDKSNFIALVQQYPSAAAAAAGAVTRTDRATWENAGASKTARVLVAGFEVNQDFFNQCVELMAAIKAGQAEGGPTQLTL